jgi:tetratricopeptide (TPR) repeat protein
MERLDPEQDNFRAALERAHATGDRETALRLAGALYPYWFFRGLIAEGRRRLAQALDGETGRSAARARALTAAGYLAWVQGDFDAAREQHAAGVALWRELDDPERLCMAVAGLAFTLLAQGDLTAARAAAEESAGMERAAVGEWMHAFALMARGFVASEQREDDVAHAALSESAALFERLGDSYEMAVALEGLGIVAWRRGDSAAARVAFERTLAAHRSEGEPWNLAEILNLLGELALRQGAPDEAATYFCESLTLYRRVGDRLSIPIVLHHLGCIARLDGEWEHAAHLLGAAQALRESAGLAGMKSPWSLTAPEEIEAEIVAVRAALGDETFAAAWASGRALTPDEAISAALRGCGDRQGSAAARPT